MGKYTREDILRIVDEEDVEFIRLQFTDMFGSMKNIAITVSQLEKALNNDCMFDSSYIGGFLPVEESDLYLHPILDTFEIFPWRPQQGKVARFICDLYTPSREPFMGDSRYVLKKVVEKANSLGYVFNVGPECEFFLFHTDENGLPTTLTHEKATYFDVSPLDLGENARRDIVLTLEDMGFEIESSHHELGAAQHEIDFRYDEVLATADNLMTFKFVVKTIAKRHGLHATFMPKPIMETYGSGMHINMSLSMDGVNIFQDASDEIGLSREAYYFMGGLMKHMKAITLFTNPLVNSYKRLMPGYEAPTYISWSAKNHSPLIRIPVSKDENKRLELRSPDPSANPYLAFAVCLAAGLDGIENKIEPPKALSENVLEMTKEQREAHGIESLPGSLLEAVREFEKDEFLQDVIGEEFSKKYVEVKRKEYSEYRRQVTKWEIDEYLHKI